MKGFFSYDGSLMRVLTKIMYIVALNLLFLLCSLPFFTIGASGTAMYTVLLRFLRGDEPDILRTFFGAFRAGFKKSTLVWLGLAAAAATMSLNLRFIQQETSLWMLKIPLNFVLILWVALYAYIFPVMAYFDNNIPGYLSYAVGLAVAKLPYTVLLIVLQSVPVLLLLLLTPYVPAASLLLICCGVSFPAYISAGILLRFFRKGEGK